MLKKKEWEIVDHKINGYIVKKQNSEELKKGIDWMSEEIKKNNYNKNRARVKAIAFDAKVIAKEYIELYKNALNDN